MAAERPLLELRALAAGYGDALILRGIDLALEPGTITAVIGANGAGKSTLLKTVFGLVPVSEGEIVLDGLDIARLTTEQRLRHGVVLVPQGRCNFPLMTVHENLEMGAYTRRDGGVTADIERLYDRFEILARKRKDLAGNLSGGEQQLLEMAMAMVLSPKLMLIDEPSLGLAPEMRHRVFDSVVGLRSLGMTLLMVEQNAVQALAVADAGIVVESGRVAIEGSGVAMLDDPEVRSAYLGLRPEQVQGRAGHNG